jgi:DNA-binding transcriptional regulator of glucitol operon
VRVVIVTESFLPLGHPGASSAAGGGTLVDVRRFFTPGWLGLHVLAIVLVTAFLGFGWWQLQRAEAGNMRSWGYTFEWPLFAIFVIVMWIKMIYDEVHAEEKDEAGGEETEAPTLTAVAAQDAQNGADDPELAAYNRYLARLNAEAQRHR